MEEAKPGNADVKAHFNGADSAKKHLKDVVKQVIWDNRLSSAFDSLRTQTGDVYLHLDFEKDLTFVKNLGQGAFGTVDCYMLRDVENQDKPPRQVAVKRIKNHVETVELNAQLDPIINIKHASDEDLEMFFNEVRLMKRLKHPNLAEFVGSGTLREEDDDRELMFLVQEFLPHKLSNVLAKKKYTADQAVQWCIHIARGMQYLHEREPIIVHRDLKPDNILFNADMVAKITDFGLFTVAPPERQERRNSTKPSEALGATSFFVEASPQSSVPSITYPASTPASFTAQRKRSSSEYERRISESGVDEPVDENGRRSSATKVKRMSIKTFTSMLRTYSFTAEKFAEVSDYKMTGMTGTLKYMAPESYRCETYNEKVDQYAFSMIMYELLARKEPYENSYMLPQDLAESAAYRNRRPKLPAKWPEKLKSLHQECWHADPYVRPSFKAIVQKLERMKNDKETMSALRGFATQPSCGCVVC